ncbi:DUF2079 domain-containing protein [Archangium violaceum]|uniref:DUF2079 domain-containing protein n=1 Tax=Archangium violaceum TaxID=83451 RepID=UPI0019525C37|nr:DUF2079 domain-containing protein [Archangium violaceum]QRN96301.1 DUF2079 domain-containing protein [Archangium violaceum]
MSTPSFVPASSEAASRASRLLTGFAAALCVMFLASGPLSAVSPQLGAPRTWQYVLHPLFLVGLIGSRAVDGLAEARLSRAWRNAALACAGVWCLVCQVWKYRSFAVNGVDFSIFDWMLFSTNHGRFMYSPIYDVNHFGIHPSYVLLPFVPLHRLWESPLLLCITTALVVWASLIPLWRLAMRLVGSEAIALLAAVAFLTSPWVGALLDGGFRPEVFYPVFGLTLVLGWVERRPAVWIAALVGFLSIKEDAALHASALALGTLVFDRKRWRPALAVLSVSVALFIVNTRVVQPWALAQTGHGLPTYVGFWGQYGGSPPEIALNMLRSPGRVLRDVLTSGWYKLFIPALLLPLLSRQPLVAMLPTLFILGSASYPKMHDYRMYYPVTLLPFFFWGLLEAYRHLDRPGLPAPRRLLLCAVALLSFPLWGGAYVRFGPPRTRVLDALERATGNLRTEAPPVFYAQTVLFPHLSYALSPLPFLDAASTTRPGAVVLVNPELDTFPFSREALAERVADAERRGEVEHLDEGFILLRPR